LPIWPFAWSRALRRIGARLHRLLCPEGVLRENRKSMELAQTCPEDAPLRCSFMAAMWKNSATRRDGPRTAGRTSST